LCDKIEDEISRAWGTQDKKCAWSFIGKTWREGTICKI